MKEVDTIYDMIIKSNQQRQQKQSDRQIIFHQRPFPRFDPLINILLLH